MSKKDPVEPEPVGTYVAMVFRVIGYDQDCDGSLMTRLERVNEFGEASGWRSTCIGLYPDTDVVLVSSNKGMSSLRKLGIRYHSALTGSKGKKT
jgi:hypothetical protein